MTIIFIGYSDSPELLVTHRISAHLWRQPQYAVRFSPNTGKYMHFDTAIELRTPCPASRARPFFYLKLPLCR